MDACRAPAIDSSIVTTRATLRTIASEGAQAFYRGSIAQAHRRRHAGERRADHGGRPGAVSRDRAKARRPAATAGTSLYTGGPPVSAGVALIEALQVLGNYGPRPRATVARDADYWHYLIESWKVRDRIAPHRRSRAVGGRLRRAPAGRRTPPSSSRGFDRDSAARFSEDSEEVAGGPERIGSGTSGFVVADAEAT